MVNLTQIQTGALNYIDTEIIAKAPPLQKFIIGTAIGLAMPKAEKILIEYSQHPLIKKLDVVDENGNYDLDRIEDAAIEAIKKSGSINIQGILLNEKDIEKIAESIRRVG